MVSGSISPLRHGVFKGWGGCRRSPGDVHRRWTLYGSLQWEFTLIYFAGSILDVYGYIVNDHIEYHLNKGLNMTEFYPQWHPMTKSQTWLHLSLHLKCEGKCKKRVCRLCIHRLYPNYIIISHLLYPNYIRTINYIPVISQRYPFIPIYFTSMKKCYQCSKLAPSYVGGRP